MTTSIASLQIQPLHASFGICSIADVPGTLAATGG